MKIIKIISIILPVIFIFTNSAFANSGLIISGSGTTISLPTTNSGIIENQEINGSDNENGNKSINKEIIDTIQEKFNGNNEIDKTIELINDDITSSNIELDTITTLVDELKLDIDTYKESILELDNKNKEISELTIKNINNESKIKENKKIIENLNESIESYEKLLSNYESRIYDINIEKSEKEILLSKNLELKKELEIKVSENLKEKYYKLFTVFGILSIIYLIFIINYYYKSKKITGSKQKEPIDIKRSYLNISFTILVVLYSFYSYFYLHPEYLIYLIFVASAFIIVSKNFIVSFFGAIINLSKYSIGQIVEIKGKEIKGRITAVKLFYIELMLVDDKNNYLNEKVKIPNDNFITYNVSIINSNIVNDEISLDVDNKNKEIINSIEDYLNKNLDYSIKNIGSFGNKKFDKKIIINDGIMKITYLWNDKYSKNLEIKQFIIELILNFKEEQEVIKN